MALKRLDNVAVVVDDLGAAIAFFKELGMELEGEASMEGDLVDRLVGLHGTKSDIAMMRTPDGHGRLELTRYRHPAAVGPDPRSEPPNTRGMSRVMFAVDDIDDDVTRLQALGAELVGEIVRYEDSYRLCYLRGPEGIIVALAQEL
jgi:catechol 2,3-dioxygenase-like lactoylglutathione lyase family enzyme